MNATRRAVALLAGTVVLLTGTIAFSNQPEVVPGAYLMPSGCCSLDVRRSASGLTSFSIKAVGANGHSCAIAGWIESGRAIVQEGAGMPACEVTFAPREGAIEVRIVEGAEAGCRGFCGARARFDGDYLQPQPGCSHSAVTAARKSFRQAYDRKEFARARGLLEPVIAGCSAWVHWLEFGWIRNDLALAQFRADDAAACRQTLAGFGPLIDATETDLRNQHNYPPSDATSLAAVLRAARYNRTLCANSPAMPNSGG
jgi:hypothetical protein